MQKKLVALLVVALVSSMFLFANQIDAQLWTLQARTANLDSLGKAVVLSMYQKNGFPPSLLNSLFGLGIGSFIQGDTTGGIVGLAGDLASLGLIIGGAVSGGGGSPLAIAGYVSLAVFRFFEVIEPFAFAKSYNLKLTDAIMLNGNLGIIPAVGKQAPGVALVGSVKF